ncbi:MAG: ATPase [Lachnospiraceae bacterium]|nr:ATPase [Lachnospiraceae bacterium]
MSADNNVVIPDPENLVLGIELGSTNIKAVLIDENHVPVASGSHGWENRLENGIWTYSMEDIHTGIRDCYADLVKNFGRPITKVRAMGVSAMMHGYLPFDAEGELLTPFRTWRNTITGEAAEKLTELFGFNIPQRWSIAHLYQAYLNGEEHVGKIDFLTTLAGYIHWRLTGVKAVGVGEASGMFPIDEKTGDYNSIMLEKYKELTGTDLSSILPKVLTAGEEAGRLTAEGALFLDPSGVLEAGIPLAPCEGDAGTGMTATNSVRTATGNVSAGTSDFIMIVTDKLPEVRREIDMVTTPDGKPVAMVHCNNCTSDINAWASIFDEFCTLMGFEADKGEIFTRLFTKALEADPACGGLVSCNYYSGEDVTGFTEGRPVFMRMQNADFSLANFMRMHLTSALVTLKIGLDILHGAGEVRLEKLCGHGGFFKTPKIGQLVLSAAAKAPVTVMETAGEGGPYGMALLASYMVCRKDGESLADYLDNRVFADTKCVTLMAEQADIDGFEAYTERFRKFLAVEKAAVEVL